mgnify:CR=1 FL=1
MRACNRRPSIVAVLVPGAVAARHDRGRPAGRRTGAPIPDWTAQSIRQHDPAVAGDQAQPRGRSPISSPGFSRGVVAAVLLARLVRRAWQRRRGLVRIGYPDGRFVEVTPGTSVLEASRLAGIPHAHVCGGRGRCSTCRVRVRGRDPQHRSARRGGSARAAPHRRNAQCAPRLPAAPARCGRGDAAVAAFAHAADGQRRVDFAQGSEREIAILFADIRGFTGLAEGRLPYDVVFVLNRYFAAMGRAVEAAGGRVDKFIGDGVMALFGIERDAEPAAGKRSPPLG